jgi:hypothetical protein
VHNLNIASFAAVTAVTTVTNIIKGREEMFIIGVESETLSLSADGL